MCEWFSSNLLSLNFGKTYFMHFKLNIAVMSINYINKIILNTSTLKVLGIIINNTFSWKSLIDTVTPKSNQTCYVVRVVKPFLLQVILKMIYYVYFHSVIT